MAEKKALLPAYLIVGEDQLKREHMLRALTKRFSEMGDITLNSTTFTGKSVAGGDGIVDACNTIPFCSDLRLVVVKDLDHLDKAAQDALVSYLEQPCPTTVLAVEGEKLAKNTRLYKAFQKVGENAIIDCAPRKRKEMPQLVRSMAVSHGVTITERAAQRLIELVGNSTIALDTELVKLASSVGSKGTSEISLADVDELVTRRAEVKPWELCDALSARDGRKCLTLLSRMPDQSPHALLAICLIRVRELLTAKALERRPGAPSLESVLGVPDWRVKNHHRWAAGFDEDELVDLLVAGAEAESQMKSGGDPDLLLESWILGACGV